MKIRQIEPGDYPALKEFLYHAIFIPHGASLPSRDIIYEPDIYIYIEGFGGKNDCGVVAEQDGKIIGAAWTRIIPAFGHIDNDTPELAISVLPEHRGQGVGTKLLEQLFDLLYERGYRQTSLSVQKANPAARLYLRMGYKIIRENEDDYIMLRKLIGPFEIEPAKREELFEIASFLDTCWKTEYDHIIAEDFLCHMSVSERYEKLLIRFDQGTSGFLTMRAYGKLIGVAIFGKSFTRNYPDDGEISAIYLHHDFIGKGYGHALLSHIEQSLADMEYSHFVLDVLSENKRAVNFYVAHQYEKVADSYIELGEKEYPLTIFRKAYTNSF